jgi:hypothetical protein
MALGSLLDIIKMNNADPSIGIIEEVVPYIPEMSMIPARPIPGINFQALVRTALPTAAFRSANEGVTPSKSTTELRLFETFFLNPVWKCDKMVADSCIDGALAHIFGEGVAMTTAAMITVSSQIYYGRGVGGDAKGFPGVIKSVDATLVLDAGGTTDNVSTSVWAMKFGVNACSLVIGNNGQLALSDLRIGDITDPNDSTKQLTGYIQEITSRIGFQQLNRYAVGRIKKLTTDAGKGLTDALLSQLYEKFPVGWKPDVFAMSRRSQGQLQRSRTATSESGKEADLPTSWQGIPFMVTDSITNTETLNL